MLKAAERVVAQEIGDAESAAAAAQAASKIYETLSRQLSPVLGEAGFQALYRRSVKLIKPRFPSLDVLTTNQEARALRDELGARLETLTPAASKEIGVALLATFGGLLASFIGERLTWKLLHDAWPQAVTIPPASPETT